MDALSPERWQQISGILDQALDLPNEARSAFLDKACADDPTLRAEVEALLEAESETDELLEDAIRGLAGELAQEAEDMRPARLIGRQIGPYKILKQLGTGGMGAVFLAKRNDFKKLVALKLIRRGMDSDEILQRFRNERQILAALDHPNIARLLDGGRTEDGLPYFVMEYVDGLAIDRYCDRHKQTIVERLKLFQTVCEAVQYAHQNLIVHRDLKPSNILITNKEQVKLLDFGIAKVLNPSLSSVDVAVTRTELRVMTPEYASPEQVLGEKITTASDVYSLGVLLYELLTGHRPYRLKGRLHHEIARVITEEEPTRPSTVVTEVEEVQQDGAISTITPKVVVEARSTRVERLKKRLRGDLDNIVLMALRKEPKRRYVSARDLGEDIGRHLHGLPVEAHSATMGYRMAKFVQRHRVGVIAATFAVLALVAGLGVALWQARVAAAERDVARLEAAKSEQVTDFLVQVFEVSDPSTVSGDTITAREILEQGVARVETELADQPEVQADLMRVMGRVYHSLGLYEDALPLLERALAQHERLYGPDHEAVAQTLTPLAMVRRLIGTDEVAMADEERALRIRRQRLGPDHPDVAVSLSHLGNMLMFKGQYDEAKAHYEEALAIRKGAFGEEHALVASSLGDLGMLHNNKDEGEVGEHYYRQALALLRKRPDENMAAIAAKTNDLAFVLSNMGKYDESEAFFLESIALNQKLYGEIHPQIATAYNNLGILMMNKGDYEASESYYRASISMLRTFLQRDNARLAARINNLAVLFRTKGDYDQASQYASEAMAMRQRLFGLDHIAVSRSFVTLGLIASLSGQPDEAVRQYQASLAIRRRLFSGDHNLVAQVLRYLAGANRDRDTREQALALFTEEAEMLARLYPDGHRRTATAHLERGRLLLDLSRPEAARKAFQTALDLRTTLFSAHDSPTQEARSLLGSALTANARYAEAEPLLKQSYEALQAEHGDDDTRTLEARDRLRALYQAWGKPDQAALYQRLAGA